MSVRPKLAFLITVAALAAPTPAWAIGDCIPGSDWPAQRADAAVLVTLVNQHRATLGLAALQVSPTLTDAAEWKSRHMAEFSYMQHSDLNYPVQGEARPMIDRVQTCGFGGRAGENIGTGYTTPQSVMAAWLNSPGHRASIEYPAFTVIGVAGAGTHWTQEFGIASSSALAVEFRSFTAGRVSSGVRVAWRTASEVDTLGFNVYREVNGRRVRVNRRLIAAKGRSSYSLLDRRASKTKSFRYWIQVVDMDGSRRWYASARVLRT